MDSNGIIEDSIVEFSQMEIGQAYSIRLVSGSIIFGVLAVKTEYLSDKSEIVKVHRIAFGNSKFLDLQEDDIEQINSFKDFSENHKEQTEYFKDFEKKYGVICLDCNDGFLTDRRFFFDEKCNRCIFIYTFLIEASNNSSPF